MNRVCRNCPHYSHSTLFPRKCWHSPQCIIGALLDLLFVSLSLFFMIIRTPEQEVMERKRKPKST